MSARSARGCQGTSCQAGQGDCKVFDIAKVRRIQLSRIPEWKAPCWSAPGNDNPDGKGSPPERLFDAAHGMENWHGTMPWPGHRGDRRLPSHGGSPCFSPPSRRVTAMFSSSSWAGGHFAGGAHHQILGVLFMGKGDLADGLFAGKQHDHAVHAGAIWGRRAVGEGVDTWQGNFGLHLLHLATSSKAFTP